MPGGGDVGGGAQAVYYRYDGSFEGFLCCVYDSVYRRETPLCITAERDAPALLGAERPVATDGERAARVRDSIARRISPRALELCRNVFCSCLAQRELHLLRFLLRGYREGGGICQKSGDELVSRLLSAEKRLLGEAHLLKGFIRFARAEGMLVAFITPKNYVLPCIAEHFCLRLAQERFAIIDKTHGAALLYGEGEARVLRVESLRAPELSAEEAGWQALWKRFYDTVAIEGRENPRCRMSHMPRRYWENMPEVADLL